MDNPFSYFAFAAMQDIHQLSSVEKYFSYFELLRSFILWKFSEVYDYYFLSAFINGLKTEIQVYVVQYHPHNLLDAYELALIQEYSLKFKKNYPILDCAKENVQDTTKPVYAAAFNDTTNAIACLVYSRCFADCTHKCLPIDVVVSYDKVQEDIFLPPDNVTVAVASLEGSPKTAPVSVNSLVLVDSPFVRSICSLNKSLVCTRPVGLSLSMTSEFNCFVLFVDFCCLGSSGWPPPARAFHFKVEAIMNVLLPLQQFDVNAFVHSLVIYFSVEAKMLVELIQFLAFAKGYVNVAALVPMNTLFHKRLCDTLVALNVIVGDNAVIVGDNYSLSDPSWDSGVQNTVVVALVISFSVFPVLSNTATMVLQVSVELLLLKYPRITTMLAFLCV